ncbi:conserved hypothetical protein [Nautilia profundicola AmH]|uniref:DUF177 domain-containing protein n=1 Tax=Nautilia profundicola (strain ATCC BAA-1463 / DSM 18972 / AmH) TaxID=598659 RepID=B9L890_NAUPA|nr:hypothetical protein [Nautilia profundicola]ACM93584.1 conserved hypothetical protein [Nautilia profundicola AmH]
MEINKSFQGLELKAKSNKLKDGTFIIEGKLQGNVEVECIKCLKTFNREVNEDVKFKIVKPPYKGFDEEYDIIEMEKFDPTELLKSEVESIKNDYNICNECKTEEFNKEF